MIKASKQRIGVIVELSREFGRGICRGIADFANSHDELEVAFLEPKTLKRPAALARFNGSIARVMNDSIANALATTHKPVVDLYYEKPRDGFGIVKTNHAKIGRLAAEHFLAHHFVNFAYCGFKAGKSSEYCLNAFRLALNRYGHTVNAYNGSAKVHYDFDPSGLITERFAPAPDAKALTHWLRALPKPVAIFCPNDLRAWQVLMLCQQSNIDVPHDVAILGLDNDAIICGFTKPMISSIDPNAKNIGAASIQLVLDMIARPALAKRSPVRQINPAHVVERASTITYPVEPAWLCDALIYIHRHLADRVMASDIYRITGKSHTLVDRIFNERLGITVQRYINAERIAEAKRLLATTSLPLAELATKCGFATDSYFIKCFTDATNVSPTAWRTQSH